MLRSLKWRFILFAAISVFAVLLCLPTVTSDLPAWFKKVLPSEKIHLGLDLQGGMHLILEVQAEKAVESHVERIKNNLRDDLKERGIPFGKIEREKTDQIVLEVSGEKSKWEKLLAERYSVMGEKSPTSLEGGIRRVTLVLDSRQADQVKKNALDQALETIRNRIDQFGVSEPEITLQGTDRILIQLPGITDPQRAIDLIGRTALLEFKLVDEEGNIEEALKGNVPEGDVILYQKAVDPKTGAVKKIPYLLKEKTLMTGELLRDARVSVDSPSSTDLMWAWNLTMSGPSSSSRLRLKMWKSDWRSCSTTSVYSAPVIQEKIAAGEGPDYRPLRHEGGQ